jgi:hypothetical protein
MLAVVAAGHPLARENLPLTREVIEQHVRLAITDRTQLTVG